MRDYLTYFYERSDVSALSGIYPSERNENVIILLNLISYIEFPSSPWN